MEQQSTGNKWNGCIKIQGITSGRRYTKYGAQGYAYVSAKGIYYQLAEDGSAFNEISGANAYYMDGHYQECEIDGQPVDEQTFIDYQNKYGELIKCYSDTMYSTVMEAYNNLEK